MSAFLTVVIAVVALGVGVVIGRIFFASSVFFGIRNGDLFAPPDSDGFGWTLEPDPAPMGTSPPRRERDTAGSGMTGLTIRIGDSNGVPGAETSRLSQTFDCGSRLTGTRYCHVTFYALFTQEDGERARVTLRSDDGSRVGYISPTTARAVRFRIGLAGCGKPVTVTFDVTPGATPNIQSVLHIFGVYSDCTTKDYTNSVEGKLVDQHGEQLRTPPVRAAG